MISVVVLAAGTSSRMGVPKQLLVYRDRPLLRVVLENLLELPVTEIIVVLGFLAERVMPVLEGLPVTIVINRDYLKGQSASLKCGLEALGNAKDPVLFALGDQPLVSPRTVELMAERHRITRGIVVPFYKGRRGNPVLFDRSFLPLMKYLDGDAGARSILEDYPEDFYRLDVVDEGVVFDIDTWEDYRRLVAGGERA